MYYHHQLSDRFRSLQCFLAILLQYGYNYLCKSYILYFSGYWPWRTINDNNRPYIYRFEHTCYITCICVITLVINSDTFTLTPPITTNAKHLYYNNIFNTEIRCNIDRPVEMTGPTGLHRCTSSRDHWSICCQQNSNKWCLQVTTATIASESWVE